MIDRIRIGLWWYSVVVVDEIIDPDHIGVLNEGSANPDDRRIRITRRSMESEGGQNTLIHEAIHCFLDQAGRDIPEGAVAVIANGVEALFTDNPDFMQICKRLRGDDGPVKALGIHGVISAEEVKAALEKAWEEDAKAIWGRKGESDDNDTRAGPGGEHQRGEPEQFGG